jgi:hypothetical protein
VATSRWPCAARVTETATTPTEPATVTALGDTPIRNNARASGSTTRVSVGRLITLKNFAMAIQR